MRFLFLVFFALLELAHDFLHHILVGLDFELFRLFLVWRLSHALGVACAIILRVPRLRECRVWLERLKLQKSWASFSADLVPAKSLYIEIVNPLVRVPV